MIKTGLKANVAERVLRTQAVAAGQLALVLLFSIVMGKAALFSGIAPQGPAFFAASWSALPGARLAALFGVLVGTMIRDGWRGLVRAGAILCFAAAGLYALDLRNRARSGPGVKGYSVVTARKKRGQRGEGDFSLWQAVVIAAASGSVSIMQNAFTFVPPGQVVSCAAEALCAGILSVLYAPGISFWDRWARGKPQMGPVDSAEASSLGVLAISLLSGTNGLSVFGVGFRDSLSSCLTTIASAAGGPGFGAITGVLAGTVPLLNGSRLTTAMARYAFGGLVGGSFRQAGKAGAVLGFLLGSGTISIYAAPIGEAGRDIAAAALGSAVLFLVPHTVLEMVALAIPSVRPASAEFLGVREQKLREELSGRLRQLAMVVRELSRAYEQVAPTASIEKDSVPPAFADLASRVCRSCPGYTACWEKEFFKTYRSLLDMMTVGETAGGLIMDEIPNEIRLNCRRLPELTAAVNYVLELNKLNAGWRERLKEGRAALVSQAKGVAVAIDRLAAEIKQPEEAQEPSTGTLPRCVTGVARVTRSGGVVSGDSYLVKELDKARTLLVLSDGMGSGPRAAMESRATIALLEKLLDAGFDRESALRTANSIMVMRSPDEVFATLDIAIINLQAGEAEFMKIGAAPSFLKRSHEVTAIKSQTLPMGIVSNIEVETIQKLISNGDIILMATDGVVDSRKDIDPPEQWICVFLSRLKSENPQDIAKRVLDKALENWRRSGLQDIPDDMTVLVAKVNL
ncbi:MAG TPA: SpoIIE family protein phosphatase [Firmicutes bacterium]|nr:SpoIIE family protein phosphatase [Bacillota bacterium]